MPDPRADLIRYYRLLRQHGNNDSHSGNGSVRAGDRAWLTPTGASGDTVEAADLIECTLDAPPPAGASIDAALHLAVYRAVDAAGAILHSHGPHAIALSLGGDDFVPVDFEGQLLFPCVPVLDIALADHATQAPARVAEVMADHAVVILRGHGIYARGRDLNEAYRWNCQVEASARITWLAGNATATRGSANPRMAH